MGTGSWHTSETETGKLVATLQAHITQALGASTRSQHCLTTGHGAARQSLVDPEITANMATTPSLHYIIPGQARATLGQRTLNLHNTRARQSNEADTTNAQPAHTCMKGNEAAATQTGSETGRPKCSQEMYIEIGEIGRNHTWHQPARAIKRLGQEKSLQQQADEPLEASGKLSRS